MPRPLACSSSASAMIRSSAAASRRHTARSARPDRRPFSIPAERADRDCPRLSDPGGDGRTGLRLGPGDQSGRRDARHLDPQVDPVAQRPRDPSLVSLRDRRRGRRTAVPTSRRTRTDTDSSRPRAGIGPGSCSPDRRARSRRSPPPSAGAAPRGRLGRTREARRGTGPPGRPKSLRRARGAALRRPCRRRRSCGEVLGTVVACRSSRSGPSPAADATTVAVSAAASSSGGSNPGIVRARSVLPEPGGPTRSRPWPPASAISRPRRAWTWPRTSRMSGTARPDASTRRTTGESGRPTSSIRGGADRDRRRRPLDRTTSTASARVSTPTTSSPAISRASSTAALATTTRRRPRRASTATIGSTPGTARTSRAE